MNKQGRLRKRAAFVVPGPAQPVGPGDQNYGINAPAGARNDSFLLLASRRWAANTRTMGASIEGGLDFEWRIS